MFEDVSFGAAVGRTYDGSDIQYAVRIYAVCDLGLNCTCHWQRGTRVRLACMPAWANGRALSASSIATRTHAQNSSRYLIYPILYLRTGKSIEFLPINCVPARHHIVLCCFFFICCVRVSIHIHLADAATPLAAPMMIMMTTMMVHTLT